MQPDAMLDLNDLRADPPEHCERVVVAGVHNFRFRWYVSDPSDWRLLAESDNTEDFLLTMRDDRTTAQMLQCHLSPFVELFDAADESEIQDILRDVFPSFYYNFDRKEAVVFVDEVFGAYFLVPDDWIWKVHASLAVIPDRERYWVIDGTDLIKKHLFDWTQVECTFDSKKARASETETTQIASGYRSKIRPRWCFWKRRDG